jgi:hypothetical protein
VKRQQRRHARNGIPRAEVPRGRAVELDGDEPDAALFQARVLVLDEVADQRRDVSAAAAPGRRPEGYQRRGAGGVEGEELVEVGWGADPGQRVLDLARGGRGARDLRVEDAVFGA